MSLPSGLDPLVQRSRAGAHALCLLDGFLLVRDGHPISLPVGGQRLVALLGLAGPRSRAVTAGTLWPEVSEEHAHGSLRTALWRLHRLWPDLVTAAEHRVALHTAIQVDTHALVRVAMQAIEGQAKLTPDEHCLAAFAGGELLPGWYDDWVVFERERLRQLRMHALERLSTQLVAERRFALALEAALAAMRAEPLRESAHHAVIAVHLAENNVVEARRHYEMLRGLLWTELQVEPSRELQALIAPPMVAAAP